MERWHKKQVEALEVTTTGRKKLIVFNDNFNTFRHVIETLIQVCKHTPEQAEQCTWIIHHKGRCAVKEGLTKTLQPMCGLICNAGIKAEII